VRLSIVLLEHADVSTTMRQGLDRARSAREPLDERQES
jgi:hypothetical protein